MPRHPAAVAFAVSLGLHGAVGVWVNVRGHDADSRPEAPDVWSGRGVDLEAPELETALGAAPAEPMAASLEQAPSPESNQVSVTLEPECANDCAPPTTPPSKTEPPKPTDARPNARTATPTPSARPATIATKDAKALAAPAATASRTPAASNAASSSASVTSSSSASSDGAASPAADAFGAVGLPAGVRHLPKAYARALSQGSWGAAGFRTVPAGKLCEAHVSIAVGADRRLGPLEYPDERARDALPSLCLTMLENGHRLVANGEFSLDPKRLTEGAMRLRVEIEVTDAESPANAEGAPHGLWGESHEAPSAGKRGRSTFVLNSGRRVDAYLFVE